MEKSFLLKEFNPAFLNQNTPFDGTAEEKIVSFRYADPALLSHISAQADAICVGATFYVCLPYILNGVQHVTVEFEPAGVYRSTIRDLREYVGLLEGDLGELPDPAEPDDEAFYAKAILHPQLAALAEDCVRGGKCFPTYSNGAETLDVSAVAITPAFVVEMLKAVAKHLELNDYDTAEFVNDGMTGLTGGQGHLVKLVMTGV